MTVDEKYAECVAAMEEFVARCEAGFIRSSKTYGKFKEILDRHAGRAAQSPAFSESSIDATVAQWCGSGDDLDTPDGAPSAPDVQGPDGEVRQ